MLPTSSAEATIVPLLIDDQIRYTFMENEDEGQLYVDLNERLMGLEILLTVDSEALQPIIEDAKGFRLLQDEKEEVLMRIDWLQRLYKVQQRLSDLQTIEEAEENKRLISPCQTSPLKNHLLTKLDALAQSLPSEQVEEVQMTDAEVLMDKAIEEAGNSFINLGKVGREIIVQEALEKFGSNVSIDYIQEATKSLEQQVAQLAKAENEEAFQTQLVNLPLLHYANLSAERKQMVTEQLMDKRNWKGLASLDRMILHLDSAMNAAEEKESMLSDEIGFVTTLDVKRLDGLAIQVR